MEAAAKVSSLKGFEQVKNIYLGADRSLWMTTCLQQVWEAKQMYAKEIDKTKYIYALSVQDFQNLTPVPGSLSVARQRIPLVVFQKDEILSYFVNPLAFCPNLFYPLDHSPVCVPSGLLLGPPPIFILVTVPKMMLKLPARNSSVDFSEHGYVIEEFVGKGQFGRAYKVRFQPDHSVWLAKAIDLGALDVKDKLLSLQEAGVMQTLRHPGIVEWRESFVHQDTFLVIIMEFCEQGDLASKMERLRMNNQRLSETEVTHTIAQIAEALHYIHSRRIVHRDIKPSNIFITEDGDVKIGDFGISRVMTSTVSLACTAVGTPQYMAPEMCESKPCTYKSDIWAFGCVGYEIAALKNAFQAGSFLALARAISASPAPKLPPEYSQEMQQLIDSLLDKEPSHRPSAAAVLSLPIIRRHRLAMAVQRCGEKNSSQVPEEENDWAGLRLPGVDGYASITPALQGGGLAARQRTELKQRSLPRRGSEDSTTFRSHQFYVLLARIWRGIDQTFADHDLIENIWNPTSRTFIDLDVTVPLSFAALKAISERVEALVSDQELELVLDRLCLTLGDSLASVGELREALHPSRWQVSFGRAASKAREILKDSDPTVKRDILLGGFTSFDHNSSLKISRVFFRAAVHIFFPELSSAGLNFLFHFAPKSPAGEVLYMRLLDDDIFSAEQLHCSCITCCPAEPTTAQTPEAEPACKYHSKTEDLLSLLPSYDEAEMMPRPWQDGLRVLDGEEHEWMYKPSSQPPVYARQVCLETPDRCADDRQSCETPRSCEPGGRAKERRAARTVAWHDECSKRRRASSGSVIGGNEFLFSWESPQPRRQSFPPLGETTGRADGCASHRSTNSADDTFTNTSQMQQTGEHSRYRFSALRGYAHPLMSNRDRTSEFRSSTNETPNNAASFHKHQKHRSVMFASKSPVVRSDASTAAGTSISPGSCPTSPNSNIVDLFKSLGAAFTGLRLREATGRISGSPQSRPQDSCDSSSELEWRAADQIASHPPRYLISSRYSQPTMDMRTSSEDPLPVVRYFPTALKPVLREAENSGARMARTPDNSIYPPSSPEVLSLSCSSKQRRRDSLEAPAQQAEIPSPLGSSILRRLASPMASVKSYGRSQHSRAVEGRAERTASCRIVAALSSQPSQPSAVEKGFARLIEARRRSDDAMGAAMRTVMLSFHAQRILLGRISAKEGPAFTALSESSSFATTLFSVRDGCLLLRGVCVTLSEHRSSVDRISRCVRSGEESPWTSASSGDDEEREFYAEIASLWSTRFLFISETLTQDISRLLHWTIHLVSALRNSPLRGYQSINQLKELLSCQVAFFASRHFTEHLKGNWEAARLFMGLVVARKSTAASMGPGVLNVTEQTEGSGLTSESTLSVLEAKLLHSTDPETISSWNRIASATLTKLQSAAIDYVQQLFTDFRFGFEDTVCSCTNGVSVAASKDVQAGGRRLSLPYWLHADKKFTGED